MLLVSILVLPALGAAGDRRRPLAALGGLGGGRRQRGRAGPRASARRSGWSATVRWPGAAGCCAPTP